MWLSTTEWPAPPDVWIVGLYRDQTPPFYAIRVMLTSDGWRTADTSGALDVVDPPLFWARAPKFH